MMAGKVVRQVVALVVIMVEWIIGFMRMIKNRQPKGVHKCRLGVTVCATMW